jgi:hypothetical protein
MAVSKARGQSENNNAVLFKILDTAGTPTIVNVSPLNAAGDISIVDTATGIYDVTIKNMQGPQQASNILVTPYVVSTSAAVTARSYSGADLSFTIKVNLDDATDTDSSCDVRVETF